MREQRSENGPGVPIGEGACLCAVIVLPLAFNLLAARVFEIEKVVLLRSLAAFAGAGLIAARPWREPRSRHPISLAALLLLAALVPATAVSLTPTQSLLGGYHRVGGFWTHAATLTLLLTSAVVFRGAASIHRLLHAVAVGGTCAAIYAVLQRAGLDPVAWDAAGWGGDPVARTPGTFGNPTTLAGYLALTLPLTAAAAAGAWPTRGAAGWLLAAAVPIQLLALFATSSRAAVLALFLAFAAVAPFVLRHSRRVLMVPILGAAALLALLLIAPRLTDASGETARVRVLLWRSALQAMQSGPLERVDGNADAVAAWRPVIGYGPETQQILIARHFPPALGRLERTNAVADRTHNILLDYWLTSGASGALAWLALAAAILASAYKLLLHARGETSEMRIVSFAVVMACLAHLVEQQFSVPSVPSAALFAILAGVMVTLPRYATGVTQGSVTPWGSFALLAALVLTIAFAPQFGGPAALGAVVGASGSNSVAIGRIALLFTMPTLLTIAIAIAFAHRLSGPGDPQRRFVRRTAGAAAVVAATLHVPSFYADAHSRVGRSLVTRSRATMAPEAYRGAVRIMSREPQYRLELASAAVSASYASPSERERSYEGAAEILMDGIGEDFDVQRLRAAARLYLHWAAVSPDALVRTSRAAQASALYERLTVLSPSDPGVWVEWGLTAAQGFGDRAVVRERALRALHLDPARADAADLLQSVQAAAR